MAVQKKRKTRSQRDKRRSQIKVKKPSITNDQITGETHIRHTISPQGFYRGKQVIVVKEKEQSESEEG